MQIGITESENFSLTAIKQLETLGNVVLFDNKQDFNNFISNKDTLFVRLKRFWGEDLLNYAPKLKYLCTPTTGLNHVDLNYTKTRNISVISLKGEHKFLNTIAATPEHTFGLLIALLRNYNRAFLNNQNINWNRDIYKGEELQGRTVGIIGFGRIGKILAKYLKTFGAIVYFFDIKKDVAPSYRAIKTKSIDELINKSSIVILAASYSPEYYAFFNQQYIDLLKNKYFINTSRGELVDEGYLLSKIKGNYFKGIALDVISNENKTNNLGEFIKYTNRYNLIVTPHIGGCTYESMSKTENYLVSKLIKLCQKI